jgi:hypothetical protein
MTTPAPSRSLIPPRRHGSLSQARTAARLVKPPLRRRAGLGAKPPLR